MADTAIAEMPNRKPRASRRALKDKKPSGNEANIVAGKVSDAAPSPIQIPSDSNLAKENHESLSQPRTSPKKSVKAAAFKKQARQKQTQPSLKKEKTEELLKEKDEILKIKEKELEMKDFKEVSNILGAKWKNFSPEEKRPYKERYQVEKEAYLQVTAKEKSEVEAMHLLEEEHKQKMAMELLEQYMRFKQEAKKENKKSKKEKNPWKPKHPMSAFFLFTNDRRPALAAENKTVTEITGEEWKNMIEEQKLPYEEMTRKNKEKKQKKKKKKKKEEEEKKVWNEKAAEAMEAYKEIMYSELSPNGSLKLYHFIAMVTVVMIVISQLPTFHSLRHINFVSLLLSLGYSFLVVGACVYAGASKNPPARDYSLESSTSTRLFSAFTSISIFAAIFGNGILPEIQATLAPPATGKMVKGLVMCYAVIFITFYSTAVSGYWVFGNKSSSNILNSLMPDEGPSLAPTWVLGLTVIFVLLQLLAIGLVYSQVAYEIMEQKSADVKQGMFSKRNLIPRIILRSLYMALCGFFAAMLPFFGDISGVVGAVGFIPLDFILPMLLYNKTYKPAKSTFTYWMNISIIIVFTGAGLLGTFSSVRKLVLDANRFKLFSDDVVD
ncbi:unnamed protein product [Malus baccata var. baccata]